MSIVTDMLEDKRLRYLLAGLYNTAFGYGFFVLMYTLFKDSYHYMVIYIFCQFVAITNAFLTYRYGVFKTKGNILLEYLRFNAVYGVATLTALAMMPFLVELAGLSPIISQTIIMVITVVMSYYGHSRFSFRSR